MKISLIVPVYNAGSYIGAFLESVTAQTLDGIQVILVDDRGSDDSINIARKYIREHPSEKEFIILDAGTNRGPGGARNLGIEKAAGEYLVFADSDDLLEPEYCEALYTAAKKHDADIVCCDARYGDKILSNRAVHTGILEKKSRKKTLAGFVTYLWTYAFRREFILENGIRFPLQRSAEDSCFVTCSWLSARSSAYIERPLYRYIPRDTSVSRVKERARWKNRINSFCKVKEYAKEKNIYRQYRCAIDRLCFKKGTLLAIKDYLTNL